MLGVFGAWKGKRWCLILVENNNNKKKIGVCFSLVFLCLSLMFFCVFAVRDRDGSSQSNNYRQDVTELPRYVRGKVCSVPFNRGYSNVSYVFSVATATAKETILLLCFFFVFFVFLETRSTRRGKIAFDDATQWNEQS